MYDILYNKAKCTWVHAFDLRTLLSSFQSQILEGLVPFFKNICIIIIFTYNTYIIYIIYTYIFLKCTQFLKINAGNSLSDMIVSKSRTMHPHLPPLTIGKSVLKKFDNHYVF